MALHSNAAVIGQTIIGLFFVIAGVNQFFNLDQMKAYADAKGVPAVDVVIPAVALFLAVGGVAILVDPFIGTDTLTYGAIIGIVATIAITLIMHDFWRMADKDQHLMTVDGANGGEAKMLPPMDNEVFHFLKNIALVGGLLLLLT